MLQLNGVLTQDAYTEALTLSSKFAGRLVYSIENNQAAVECRRIMEVGGSEAGSFENEIVLNPEVNTIDHVSGVRFRSAVAGSPAKITARLSEPGDIIPGAGNPINSGQLDASARLEVPFFTAVSGITDYPSSTTTYDVSGFANLTGIVGLDPASQGAGELTFRWYADQAGTIIMGVQGFPLVSKIPSLAQLNIPNEGPFLRVSFEKIIPPVDPASNAPKLGMRLFGTNRSSRLPLQAPDSMQWTFTARPIGAGAVEATYPADYFAGSCLVNWQPSIATMILQFHAYDLTLVNYVIDQKTGAAVFQTIEPFGAFFAFVQNPGGAAGTYTLNVTPNVSSA